MSEVVTTPTPSETAQGPKVTLRHYQAICGIALVAVFLLQMQRELPLVLNVLMLFLGALSILFPVRLSPILTLACLAAAHLAEQHSQNQIFHPDFRSFRLLDISDVLLCMAVLAYVIGQYRLNGLRFGITPHASHNEPRSQDSLSAAELVALVFPVPLAALVAELVLLLLRQRWEMLGLDAQWRQIFALTWAIVIGLFVAAQAFRYWRRLQMDRAMALLALQDVVWNETRGEQRRIFRWIVWGELRHENARN
jgi:hypothetical protein